MANVEQFWKLNENITNFVPNFHMHIWRQKVWLKGRGGGGQVVGGLTYNSDYSSSNPANDCSFSAILVFEKTENKQKEAGVGPFLRYGSSVMSLGSIIITM